MKSISHYLKGDDKKIHDYIIKKSTSLRYGENPHQSAMLFTFDNLENRNIANAEIIQGKELSYNNIVDADAAWECVREFINPACVIVKHANPCGVAEANSIDDAYDLAFKTDPTSAFGGIIALNKKVGLATAKEINSRQFVEVIIAPEFEEEAEHFVSGLELLGFESAYLSRTLGTAFIWVLLMSVGLLVIVVLMPF